MIALLLLGCDDGDGAVDAGPPDAGAPDTGLAIAPIALPMPPRLTPCADGWRELTDTLTDVTRCDPWPAEGRLDCPDGETHFVGEPGCHRVGGVCPMDGFPADVPTDAVYVSAGATGGDGSRASPFGTLQEGIDAAPDGGTVAVGVGDYPEPNFLRERDLTIIGACQDTRVFTDTGIPFFVRLGRLDLRRMTIGGNVLGVSLNASDGTLRELTFETRGTSISVANYGVVDAERIWHRSGADSAIRVQAGGRLTLRHAVIESGRGSAMEASGGTLEASDVLVREMGGDLVLGFEGAQIQLSRAWLGDGPESTIFATTGSHIGLREVVVRGGDVVGDTQSLGALFGSTLEVERAWLDGLPLVAAGALDPDASLSVTDVVVTDPVSVPALGAGHGFEVVDGAEATFTRVRVERATELGFLITGAGTTATLTDVDVRDTVAGPLSYGRALQTQVGAVVEGTRIAVAGSRELAVVVAGEGARATYRELTVVGTEERSCASTTCQGFGAGTALGAYQGGALDVARFEVAQSALIGAQVADGSAIDLAEGIVRDNPVGINVQVNGYDLSRLTRGVAYRNNGVNLDATSLPLPELDTLVVSSGP